MSLPYQPTCDTLGPHRMTRDSDVSSKPSNNLGRQARYPSHADRGGSSRNETRCPEGPGGGGHYVLRGTRRASPTCPWFQPVW